MTTKERRIFRCLKGGGMLVIRGEEGSVLIPHDLVSGKDSDWGIFVWDWLSLKETTKLVSLGLMKLTSVSPETRSRLKLSHIEPTEHYWKWNRSLEPGELGRAYWQQLVPTTMGLERFRMAQVGRKGPRGPRPHRIREHRPLRNVKGLCTAYIYD